MNVFDERELELLIGGIADIDVDDWKKHTDYRGYTESDEVIGFFWKVCTRFEYVHKESASDDWHSAFEHGTQNRSLACYNMPLELLESP